MKDLNCETSKEDALTAFIQVLDIDSSMAEFFLEAAAWNIETAVVQYLENMQQGQSSSQLLAQQFSVDAMGGLGSGSRFKAVRREKRFNGIDVFIHNLPEGWGARVSSHSGEVYFYHDSGHIQREVPPGFADLPPQESEADGAGKMKTYGDGSDSMFSNNNPGGTGGIGASSPAVFDFRPPNPPAASSGTVAGTGGGGGGGGGDNQFQSWDSTGIDASGSITSGTGHDADLTDDNTEAAVMGDTEAQDDEMT